MPLLSPSRSSPLGKSYQIKCAGEEHSEAILQHLREFFFQDEPLNIAVNLVDQHNPTCVELEEYSLKSIKEGMSLMAISDTNKIIGVCINGTISRIVAHKKDNDQCKNPRFKKILNLLEHIDKQADVFGKFPNVDKILSVVILSVDGAWRGMGIAKEMMDISRDMARRKNYGLMRVDCSSYYSARAIAKLGFDCIFTLKYQDYKINGEAIISPEEPHTEAKVYVQRII